MPERGELSGRAVGSACYDYTRMPRRSPHDESAAGVPPLLRAVRALLRPLVRLLISEQVTYPTLAELLKSVYVEIAEDEFALDDKPQTDSRIKVLTGIHRRDVKRLRESEADEPGPPKNVAMGSKLVARWLAQRRYLDSRGRPKPLPRLYADGGATSFEALAEAVNKDIRPRALLDECLRLGVVHIDDRDRVCLNVEAFVPESGFEEKAFYFGRNVGDHIAAGAHNLEGGEPPMLERSVHYNHLTPDSVEKLERLARRSAMTAIRIVNRRALEYQRRDRRKRNADSRIQFGVYFFNEPERSEDERDD